jgi:hypothetical protein
MRWIVVLALVLPALSQAGESCPWLNEATAAGVLGGAVQITVAHPGKDADDAVCDFVRTPGSELHIRVETMYNARREFASYTARCRANAAPLRGIGNEAAACSADGDKGQIAEQVAGRVRNRAFLVRISSAGQAAPRNTLRENARNVAEQVAGALF